jgi:hypothetical protein
MKREVYNITIDKVLAAKNKQLGINQIAYTDNPAIEIKGLAFSSQVEAPAFEIGNYLISKFNSVDTMKMRVASPALIPNKEIYRKDEKTGEEFYVVFDVESIEELVSNFQGKNVGTAFNVNHTQTPAPAYVMESWIIETIEDKAYAKYGFSVEDVPLGSWMIVSQITDKEFFLNEIIDKKQYGYSVEGFFDLVLQLTQQKNSEMEKKEKEVYELDGKFFSVENGKLIPLKAETEEKEVEATEEEKVEAETEEKEVEASEDEKEESVYNPENEEDKFEEEEVKEEEKEVVEFYSKDEIDEKFSNLIDMISKLESLLETKEEEIEEELEDEGRIVSLAEKFFAMKQLNKK